MRHRVERISFAKLLAQLIAVRHLAEVLPRAPILGAVVVDLRERGLPVADVERVGISAPPLIVRLVGRPPRPEAGASYTRLCMAWTVARVLINRKIYLADYRGASLMDAATLELARRVSVTTDGNPDPNALAPQRVTVRLRGGAELFWSCETMLAHPSRPLTREQHLAKFERCLRELWVRLCEVN